MGLHSMVSASSNSFFFLDRHFYVICNILKGTAAHRSDHSCTRGVDIIHDQPENTPVNFMLLSWEDKYKSLVACSLLVKMYS